MTVLEQAARASNRTKPKMEWRGSDDGITWSSWKSLIAISQKVDHYAYYQGRILLNGRWHQSKIEWD